MRRGASIGDNSHLSRVKEGLEKDTYVSNQNTPMNFYLPQCGIYD